MDQNLIEQSVEMARDSMKEVLHPEITDEKSGEVLNDWGGRIRRRKSK